MQVETIKAAIRDIPDFPKPGILFKDITPVLSDPALFRGTIDLFAEQLAGKKVDKIAAIDARGFIFGGALCDRLGIGFVPIRKAGKLPYAVHEQTYDLEYGSATVAIHQDACSAGDSVVLIDDLLATGGTAAAATKLVEQAGGTVTEIMFLVELTFLKGRDLLAGYEVFSPIQY